MLLLEEGGNIIVVVIVTQVATLKDKAKETVQVVTYNRHHYL